MKVSIVGSLRDREVACSASDRQGSNFESCVWRAVSSQSSHHPQEVLLAQFSLYVHKGGLKPDSFHFIFMHVRKSISSLFLAELVNTQHKNVKTHAIRMFTLLWKNEEVKIKLFICYEFSLSNGGEASLFYRFSTHAVGHERGMCWKCRKNRMHFKGKT